MDVIQQSAPTAPQVQIEPPKPKSNIYLLILLFILLILSLCGTAFLAYQNWQLRQQVNRFEKIIKVDNTPSGLFSLPSPTPSASQAPNGDLATWKTFTDSTNKISFKHPQTWQVEETWGTSGFANFHYLALIKNSVIKYGPEPGAIGITAWDNPKNLSLQEFENTNRGPTGSIGVYDPSAKNVALGDKNAFYSDDANCEPVLCSKYVVSANAKIFFVSVYKDAVKDDKLIVDQILSTFKFLGENSYTCPANGWIDCMPKIPKNSNDCSLEAIDWYKTNCPNFQGVAN